jgi:antitoxin CptB
MINTEDVNRIRWQCRRGMLELDALLDAFVDKCYLALSDREKDAFKLILEYPDQILFDYFFGDSKPVDKEVSDVIQSIRSAATA